MPTIDQAAIPGDPEPDPCPRCGERHWRVHLGIAHITCKGHRTNGKPCMRFRTPGAAVCKLHGSSAPQVAAKAAERIEAEAMMQRMARELTSAGEDLPYEDPIQNLLWLVSVTKRAVAWLAFRVSELSVPDPDGAGVPDIVGVDEDGDPITRQPIGAIYGPNRGGELVTHPLWREWNAMLERHAKFCKLAVDAGVSERMVRIAEAVGEQVADVMVRVLDSLGLPHETRERAKMLIAVEFNELDRRAGAIEQLGRPA